MTSSTHTRTYHSLQNLMYALVSQGLDSILTFIVRTVFIYCLGKAYLGMNGLFSDILTLLSLAELGCGTAIIYAMYHPAAVGDEKQLAALLNLYRKIYISLGLGMSLVGLCLIPFLNFFISDLPEMPELPFIYVLYLFNTTFSYFFSYKKSILIAFQVHHIVSKVNIVTVISQNLIQIAILLLTHNFLLYLFVQLLATLISNAAISSYVNRHYPFLKTYHKERLHKESKDAIIRNIKAMFLDKLSSAIVTSTDNMLISKFVSTIVLGYYSNYTLFVTIIRNIMLRISDALTGSVGNLVSSREPAHAKKIFEELLFLNFWCIAVFAILFFSFINPFIILWIGEDYLLQLPVVFLICLNLYMRYIRNTQLIFIDTYGLFQEIRIKCICEALINLIASLILLIPLKMGVAGILLGTFISNITTNFWFEPYIIYRKRFHAPVAGYFQKFIFYWTVTMLTGTAVFFIANNLQIHGGWIELSIKFILCFFLVNGVFIALFHKKPEYLFIKEKLQTIRKEHRLED
ncbi:MAG: hypothetical protein SPF70_07990 [Lachnospiraceae bacterium]|nr:hypothetical protein [Lachnospiraceae bacterium]